jgi:hypothetical protein
MTLGVYVFAECVMLTLIDASMSSIQTYQMLPSHRSKSGELDRYLDLFSHRGRHPISSPTLTLARTPSNEFVPRMICKTKEATQL